MTEHTTLWLWAGFTLVVVMLLALDLGLSSKTPKAPTLRRASLASLGWLALTLGFAVGVDRFLGRTHAIEFLSGYCIEEALSVDNLFVFLIIFGHFGIDERLQTRVLRWGIFGALVMRGIFIAAGAALLARFHWIFYGLGAFLIYTAIKLVAHNTEDDGESSPAQKLLMRVFPWPVTKTLHGSAFFVVQDNRRFVTPLAVALCVVELSDVLFALDSVPAIFAVTTDPFIVYTSNVFAILSLRSLYFVLAGMLDRFIYLKTGLAIILAFVGGKMLAHDIFEISALASLGVILGILAGTIAASFWAAPKGHKQPK